MMTHMCTAGIFVAIFIEEVPRRPNIFESIGSKSARRSNSIAVSVSHLSKPSNSGEGLSRRPILSRMLFFFSLHCFKPKSTVKHSSFWVPERKKPLP